MRLAFGFAFAGEQVGADLCESSSIRDTLRLFNFWGDDSVGVAVSIVESVHDSSKFLRSNFASRFLLRTSIHM